MQTTAKDLSKFILKGKSPEALAAIKKISVLTAYDFNTARALAEAGIDVILVGDSLAMVALGYEDTTQVSPEEMITFTKAVRRGAPDATIITDIPRITVEKEVSEVIKDSQNFIAAGADILKIEGCSKKTQTIIKELNKLKIPLMGHIGYTPQNIEVFAERKSKLVRDFEQLMSEAQTLDQLGVSSIVLEMIPADIAKQITKTISTPTIGIGAGANCDGQVLVTDDMLGRFTLFHPKFVRRYDEQYERTVSAIKKYISDVQEIQFPCDSESYS